MNAEMNAEIKVPIEDIQKVLRYFWNEEEKSFKECRREETLGQYSKHIFCNLQNIKKYLDEIGAKEHVASVSNINQRAIKRQQRKNFSSRAKSTETY